MNTSISAESEERELAGGTRAVDERHGAGELPVVARPTGS